MWIGTKAVQVGCCSWFGTKVYHLFWVGSIELLWFEGDIVTELFCVPGVVVGELSVVFTGLLLLLG